MKVEMIVRPVVVKYNDADEQACTNSLLDIREFNIPIIAFKLTGFLGIVSTPAGSSSKNE